MRRLGIVSFMLVAIIALLLPNCSFAWTTYNYITRADGTISARNELTASGTLLSTVLFDSFGRQSKLTTILEGADEIIDYAYNEVTGTSLANRHKGSGGVAAGELNESTLINAYGQQLLTVDNLSSGTWQIFSGAGRGGNTGDYNTANGDGTVGIQTAGGEAAFQAMLANGGTKVFENFTSSSGLQFDGYNGKKVVNAFTYNEQGQTKQYTLAISDKDFSSSSSGHALFVKSFSTTGANGIALKGSANNRQDMTDPGKYTDHQRFDPIVNTAGVLGGNPNDGFTLTTADGVTHSLLVGDPELIKQLSGMVGANINLTVDVLDDGTYSAMATV